MKYYRHVPSTPLSKPKALGCSIAIFSSLVAPILASFMLQAVYGVERRDSSALWMLSGVEDFMVSVCCLPAFWLVLGISSMIFISRKDDPNESIIKSVPLSLALYVGVVILAWALAMEGGRVLKAN